MLLDPYKRSINYLRISVTDRCNLRCLYCVAHNDIPKLRHEEILRYEEILRIARVGTRLGIRKIRVTGGEPLVRKGIVNFLRNLSSLKGLEDIGLTTNAILLEQNLQDIWDAGIHRLNISLDTLDRDKYQFITGLDGLTRVLGAIDEAERLGFNPIKINMVVMENINDHEVEAFARISLDRPYHVRFIEYMPIGSQPGHLKPSYIPTEAIMRRLEKIGPLEPVKRDRNDGPAQRYRFPGARGEIGFISPMTNHFCATCNRLRLTAEGKLRPCLLSDREIDIKGPIRSGATDEELASIFQKAILLKPKAHGLLQDSSHLFPGEMSSIGG